MSLLPIVAIVACDASVVREDALRYQKTQSGDTTVVVSHGVPPEFRVEPEVFWRSADLEQPRQVLLADGVVVVLDRDRVHLLSHLGREVRSVGRRGQGPGEFQRTSGVGIVGGDTLVVLDSGLRRLTYFTFDGEVVRTEALPHPYPFVNPLPGAHRMQPTPGGYFMFWRSNLDLSQSEPTPAALVRHDLGDGTYEVLQAWPDLHFQPVGTRGFALRELFTPRAYLAMSRTDLIHGDGIDYCLFRERLPTSEGANGTVLRFCRNWDAVKPGSAILSPDIARADPSVQDDLREVLRIIPVPDFLPSFDAILMDDVGRVWVRAMGPEMAQVHPMMDYATPELVPERRKWDVFEPEGLLVATVTLPADFTLRAVSATEAWGFIELATGEMVVGAAGLPTELLQGVGGIGS